MGSSSTSNQSLPSRRKQGEIMATEVQPAGTSCKSDVKDDRGVVSKCGTFIPRNSSECRNRRNHVWKFKSGYCAIGWCEGSASKDSTGKYVKTCHLWQNCNCDCHITVDKMFQIANAPRILLDNPKYVRPKSPFVMPGALSGDLLALGDTRHEGHVLTLSAPMIGAVKPVGYSETASGNRARGQLESEVLRVCQQFTRGQIEVEDLTPKIIALEIDEIEPPSVGAIGAVFDRWTKIGFANCETKPVRFVSFTVDGLMHGLDAMKERARMKARMQSSAENRGSLRRRD